MEHTISDGQVPSPAYDFRTYDQVWRRVTPGVDPFSSDPSAAGMTEAPQSAAPAAPPAAQAASGAVPAPRQEVGGNESALPGAEPNPCCMGTNAQDSVEVLEGFIQEELAGSRCCQSLACHVRSQTAARLFRRFACEKQAAAREMCGAYYLITGTRYAPAVTVEHMHWGSLTEALRSCYHQEACGGLNYARASDETTDLCLTKLFGQLSEQAYRRAEDVMSLLGKLIC
ncbi:MAG: ferritin-like domain-containing protein [Oscillibacter sp.]|nr:ferritin-like domain-containing protein [Oscillibacter sp.]